MAGGAFPTPGVGVTPVPVPVRSKADLPAPVGNIITLAPQTIYEPDGFVDITPCVFQHSLGSVLASASPNAGGFVTNSPLAMINASQNFTLSGVVLSNAGGPMFNVDGASPAIDIALRTLRIDSGEMGVIKGVRSALVEYFTAGVITSPLEFDGALGTLLFSESSLLAVGPLDHTILFKSTAVVSNKLSFGNGQLTGVRVEVGAVIPDLGVSLRMSNYVPGVDIKLIGFGLDPIEDPRLDLFQNVNTENTTALAFWYSCANAVATTFANPLEYTEIRLDNWTAKKLRRMEKDAASESAIKYTGPDVVRVAIAGSLTLIRSVGAIRPYRAALFRNGVIVPGSDAAESTATSGKPDALPMFGYIDDFTFEDILTVRLMNEQDIGEVIVVDANLMLTSQR